MGSNHHHLELTPGEAALVEKIDLRDRIPPGEDARAIHLANQEPILALMRSLIDRNGIPEQRKRYWGDPDYNTSRGKGSHKQMFEANGVYAPEVYTNPHFLRFLRYFLHGADLPQPVITAFEQQVGNPEWFTSGDYPALRTLVRSLMRQHRLDNGYAPEEFYKLTLDVGLDSYAAADIRRCAMSVR